MSREEFSRRTKLEAFTRCKGTCERCMAILRPGHFDYDHDKPAAFGGRNDAANCRVLCRACHDAKTFGSDIPAIAKTNRIRKREAGLKKRSTFAASRDGKWKRKVDGSVVRR